MNYDLTGIADTYSQARQLLPEAVKMWLRALRPYVEAERTVTLLDVGCGTGRFCRPIRARYRCHVIGIDPSTSMLSARIESGTTVLKGRAEAIPLESECADVAFLSMTYHHLEDVELATSEMRRVLRPGGFACVRTSTLERADGTPYLPYFPEVKASLLALLPSVGNILQAFARAGFKLVEHRVLRQLVTHTFEGYVSKVIARAYSPLMAMPVGTFELGVDRMRRAARSAKSHSVHEPIDWLVFRSSPNAHDHETRP